MMWLYSLLETLTKEKVMEGKFEAPSSLTNNFLHTPWDVVTPENGLWIEDEPGGRLMRCMRTAGVR